MKPLVTVSVLPQSFFVKQIAGDLVDVEVMLPPGANPSTYEPTISQMKAISKAVVYVSVGHPNFPFEKVWLDKLLAGNKDIRVVDSSAGVDLLDEDPHIWVSPECVRTAAKGIGSALYSAFPDKKELLKANLEQFLGRIDELDNKIKSVLDSKKGKKFFVFHPAWGYFANSYGLEQVSIEHEHKEPGPRELVRIIKDARAADVDVIFVQPQFSAESAHVLAQELGARVVIVDPLAFDWFENLEKVALSLATASRP